LTSARRVCDRDGVPGKHGLPDGWPGIVGAFIACAAAATLAIEVGVDPGVAALVGLAAAILLSIAIKIGLDMSTAKLVKAIADGDMETDTAPDGIQSRLVSARHRESLAVALRKIAEDARRYPWQGRMAAPPIILHFQPATCQRLIHLAQVLESPVTLEPRGVAVVEDLVTNPASVLYGSSDEDVEVEVRRALFILGVD
jgi:hypothetical protein